MQKHVETKQNVFIFVNKPSNTANFQRNHVGPELNYESHKPNYFPSFLGGLLSGQFTHALIFYFQLISKLVVRTVDTTIVSGLMLRFVRTRKTFVGGFPCVCRTAQARKWPSSNRGSQCSPTGTETGCSTSIGTQCRRGGSKTEASSAIGTN